MQNMTTRKIHSGFVWAINKSRIAKTHSTVTFTRELIQIIYDALEFSG